MPPTPPPYPDAGSDAALSLGRLRLPPDIRFGIVLVLLGVAFLIGGYVWPYIGVRTVLPDMTGYLETTIGLQLGALLGFQLGAFLILRGILRLLPSIGSWPRWGPLLILTGTVLAACGLAVVLVLAPYIYPPSEGPNMGIVYLGAIVVNVAGNVLVAFGTLLAFVAIAFGALAARAYARPPART